MTKVIEICDLTKYYGKKKALEKLNLEVLEGEIFGFLGPNGAGKTTTIRILLDFIRATSGTAQVFGLPVHKSSLLIKRRVSYLPSEFGLYNHLRVKDFFCYFQKFFSPSQNGKIIEKFADRFQLEGSKKIKNLSHGMRQKVAIALAFIKEPDLFILDEPTQGLDPLMQEEFYRALLEEKAKGKTIFLSSHVLSEVERICDRCAIIKEGKLVEVETIEGLTKKRLKKVRIRFASEPDFDSWRNFPGIKQPEKDGRTIQFYIGKDLKGLLQKMGEADIEDVTLENPSLEEIFLEYYKRTGE